MSKIFFISYSLKDKEEFRLLDQALKIFLKHKGMTAYAFVFDFKKKVDNRILMREALRRIDESDVLIAELSHKTIGIGLEVGYAKAKRKKIIYIHKIDSELSTTVDGIADLRIEYTDIKDLLVKLNDFLGNIIGA